MSWTVYGDWMKNVSVPQSSSLHSRRTLDQFYYPALDDTSIRDADQTISKWSGKGVAADGKPEATSDSLLLMVDQLWCWVVDESLSPVLDSSSGMLTYTSGTIISSFPSSYTLDDLVRFKGLYECVRKDATTCETVWDLHSLLVKEATGLLFNQQNRAFRDIIETYRWVTNKKVRSQFLVSPSTREASLAKPHYRLHTRRHTSRNSKKAMLSEDLAQQFMMGVMS
jgi:hypothetical protein